MINNNTNNYDLICKPAEYSELVRIREFVCQKAVHHGLNDDDANKIALAVDEACSNLIRHAYNFNKNHEICIKLKISKETFEVDIMDDGVPFNPLEVPIQNMKQYMELYKRGGLGIHIIRQIMDKIIYIPSDSKHPKNILKLIKTLNYI